MSTTTAPKIVERQASEHLEVSVVIPCLNEAESIEACVGAVRNALTAGDYTGEVVVVDNGSTDGSGELAAAAGARVVLEARRGYGSAYLTGLAAAEGRYIVMLDADMTYDAGEVPRFVHALENGGDIVLGDRMKGIQPGAMPWLHRHVGNPILTGLLNRLFGTKVNDAHCGMRAVRREALPALDLRTTGMELASEMVIRAAKASLDIRQLPIEYRQRRGESKLSTWSDGWRHLRFLLIHSPKHLFLAPGGAMAALGTLIMAAVLAHISFLGHQWDIHALIGGALMLILGTQVIALGLCAMAYGVYFMSERDEWFNRMRARFRLEHGLQIGGSVLVAGLILGGVVVGIWIENGLGSLAEQKLAVLSATLITVGAEVFFTSFLLSILGLRRPQ
ncbi:MAG: glycosyltransferase family 2 protein [Solirubrobacterales bacterium]